MIPLLLAVLLLAGCALSPAKPETTAPPLTSAVPKSTTVPPEPALTLDELLENMTVAQKVGQLFIVTPEQLLPGSDPVSAMSDALGNAFTRYPVGGIVLFRDHILSPEQLRTFNQALQDASDIPLFLCVDEEGGPVARLANHDAFDLPRYQNAASVGASENPEDARSMGSTIGAYLAEFGFNVDFAPVADVNTNPDNPVIGNRAFSDSAETAAQMASALGSFKMIPFLLTYALP